MLEITDIDVYYGDVAALTGVSLQVKQGEAVAVIGANGAGKSTLLKAISGILHPRSGCIAFDGEHIDSLPAHQIAALGIAHVPEGRRVFTDLTVLENLEMGAYLPEAKQRRRESLEMVFEMFPRLRERQRQSAGSLSGGEQQMLAIGRGMMLRPKLLMLDEPSLGLAPLMVEATFKKIEEIYRAGISLLLVEQNVVRALSLVERGYVLEEGKIVMKGASQELINDPHVKTAYLSL